MATTLVPLPRQSAASRTTPLWCLVCGDYGGVDVLNNLVLFVPLAAGLHLLGLRGPLVVAIGALTSLIIEGLQFSVIPGRDASLSDVLTNTLGSWAGSSVAFHRRQLIGPDGTLARQLALGAAVGWILVQSTSGFLLQPWLPPGELTASWGRAIPGRDRFDGRVTSAYLSGMRLAPGQTDFPQTFFDHLRAGRVRLDIEFVSGGRPLSWAPIFELHRQSTAMLSLEADGRDLVFRAPARSRMLRLRIPGLRLENALPVAPAVPVRVSGGLRGDTLWANWSTPGDAGSAVQVLRPSYGWSLIVPVNYAYGRGVPVLTALWIAAWLIPLGYWSARARTRTRLVPLVGFQALVLVAGLLIIPALFGQPRSAWFEWLGGVGGLALGWAAIRLEPYFGPRCDSRSTSESY